MKIKIFCLCSLFPSWSCKGLISTPVIRSLIMVIEQKQVGAVLM